MAAFNPFAPQGPSKAGAPQVQGHQAPNVPMQQTPSLTQQLAPTVFNKAMGSEAAGNMGTAMGESVKGAFSSLLAPAGIPTAAATNASLATGIAGGAEAALASQALSTGAVAAGTGATAGGALAGAAPVAAALGPFGIPVLIGAGLMAANSGK